MNFKERAKYVLNAEAEAIRNISESLIEEKLSLLADMILQCKGKVVLTGMGKNGHVARRVAATLSCTGTPAFFVHSAETAHGDLGMISANDILLVFSNSGKTQEIIETVEKIKAVYGQQVKIAVISGHCNSPLAELADLELIYGDVDEPCPLGLTPSSSLAVMSALSDALALGLMEMRGFTIEQYGNFHRSGYISKKIAEMKTA